MDAAAPAAPEGPLPEVVFACRRCRAPLFRPSLLAQHAAGAQSFAYRRVQKDRREAAGGGGGAGAAREEEGEEGGSGGGGGGRAGARCTSHFLSEAVQWMEAASKDVEGKLNCPGCGARLGTLAWAGSQCSCGSWVNPAIQIQKKAVEEKRVLAPLPPPGGGGSGAGAGGAGSGGAGSGSDSSSSSSGSSGSSALQPAGNA